MHIPVFLLLLSFLAKKIITYCIIPFKKFEILKFQCITTFNRSMCLYFTVISQNRIIHLFFFLYVLNIIVIKIINLDQKVFFLY